MKKFLYIIMLFSFFLGCGKIVDKEVILDTNNNVKNFHPVVIAAFNNADKLMDVEIDEENDGQNPDADKCICKGTGRIVQGDGHVTDCRYHARIRKDSEENKIQEIKEEAQEVAKLLIPKYKLMFFTADWCSPCRMQKGEIDELKAEGYSVGNSLKFDIAIIDIDQNKDLYNSFKGNTGSIPMHVVLEGNVVKERKVGFISKENILAKYYRTN